MVRHVPLRDYYGYAPEPEELLGLRFRHYESGEHWDQGLCPNCISAYDWQDASQQRLLQEVVRAYPDLYDRSERFSMLLEKIFSLPESKIEAIKEAVNHQENMRIDWAKVFDYLLSLVPEADQEK